MYKQETHIYLFELRETVVKEDAIGIYYERDKENHKWVEDMEWMRRYYDGQYDVIEIDYDEEHERIMNPRAIKGFWSKWQEDILADKSNPLFMEDTDEN